MFFHVQTEDENYLAHKCSKCQQLLFAGYIVGILTFICRINTTSENLKA